MTNEEVIEVLKNDIEICTIQQKQACDIAIKALEIELLTDTEQRIFLKAMSREREVCQKVDDEYMDEVSKVSLVEICNSIERKVKKIWE
jgi:transcriptional regulator CtsR